MARFGTVCKMPYYKKVISKQKQPSSEKSVQPLSAKDVSSQEMAVMVV